jgi:hypothetical protein
MPNEITNVKIQMPNECQMALIPKIILSPNCHLSFGFRLNFGIWHYRQPPFDSSGYPIDHME